MENESLKDLRYSLNNIEIYLKKLIYITDGVIPQCEAYCSKHAYNKMNLGVLQTAISMLNEKANDETGNSYIFVCNGKFWQDLQSTLGDYLAQFHTDGTYLWSKAANDYVKVGAKGYDSYNWGGNTITFKVDRTMTLEYGSEKGYALCLDLTGDATNSQPPIAMFSLKGKDIITNKYIGVKITVCAL